MNLKPFEVTLTRAVDRRVETRMITVWVATIKAARESAELFAREEGWPNAEISINPIDDT